jgi:O-antigen/teichoic acid export membrane protein
MPGQSSRIRWNSLFALLSQAIRLLTNFFVFVGVARFYGPEAFGQFTTAHSFSSIFLLFADFGFDTLLATEIARHRERAEELARRYFSLKIVFALGATAAMLLLPIFKSMSPSTTILTQIFSFYVLFASMNNFFFALFKGFEQFYHETKISFSINLTLLVIIVVLGAVHAPLAVIAAAFVGTRIIGLVIGLGIASRISGVGAFRFSLEGWRDVWENVLIFGSYALFGNLFFLMDTMLLAFLRGDREVGIYQSVFKIVVLVLIIPDIAINTMLPVLSRLNKTNEHQWQGLGRLLNKTLCLLSLPVSLILFVYPEQVLGFVYGPNLFGEAIPILRLFSIIVFIRYGVEAYALMLTTSRRQKSRTLIVFAGTLFNVLLNLFVIPRYGPWGAAAVSLATNLLVAIGYITLSKMPFFKWTFGLRNSILFAISAVLCYCLLNLQMISMWYGILLVTALYAAGFYFIGYTRDEWAVIFNREHGAIAI